VDVLDLIVGEHKRLQWRNFNRDIAPLFFVYNALLLFNFVKMY